MRTSASEAFISFAEAQTEASMIAKEFERASRQTRIALSELRQGPFCQMTSWQGHEELTGGQRVVGGKRDRSDSEVVRYSGANQADARCSIQCDLTALVESMLPTERRMEPTISFERATAEATMYAGAYSLAKAWDREAFAKRLRRCGGRTDVSWR